MPKVIHGVERGLDIVYYDEDGNLYEPKKLESASLQEDLPEYYRNPQSTPVKDQVLSGPCWAFAAIGALELNLMKKGELNEPDFSEAHMAYFAHNPYEERNMDGTNLGVDAYGRGGNFQYAAKLLSIFQGAADEDDAKFGDYIKSKNVQSEITEDLRYKHNAGIIRAYECDNDVQSIKETIYNLGSAAISYYSARKTGNITAENMRHITILTVHM